MHVVRSTGSGALCGPTSPHRPLSRPVLLHSSQPALTPFYQHCSPAVPSAERTACVGSLRPSARTCLLLDGSRSRCCPCRALPAVQGQGGYLQPAAAQEEWTWDDDYDPDAQAAAAAAAAAAAVPVSPRLQRLQEQQAAAALAPPTVITRLPEHISHAALRSAIMLVDKPPKWTAFDCVKALRFALKVRKAGHTATLDAMATGLVIVCLGSATALSPRFGHLDKTYSGTLRLGESTTTYDSDGKPDEQLPWEHVTDEQIAAAVAAMHGEILQVPPMWSSVKHRGRPLHWYAERGQVIERAPRPVYVRSFEAWREQGSRDVQLRVEVAKGCYVRSLGHDLGVALGTRAHLTALRREAIGQFKVENAWDMATLLPLINATKPYSN